MPLNLLDFFFPRKSLGNEEGYWITEAERRKLVLRPLHLSVEELRKRGLQSIDFVLAAGSYDESPLLKKAILTFKYKRIRELGDELAAWMTRSPQTLLPVPGEVTPILCPVPLHWTRRYQRGFNQAQLLADTIGRKYEWPVFGLLERTRVTGHQAWRSRDKRMTALRGAFRPTMHRALPSFVILVDDVCTTGATLDECAKALKMAGVSSVGAMVAAYG